MTPASEQGGKGEVELLPENLPWSLEKGQRIVDSQGRTVADCRYVAHQGQAIVNAINARTPSPKAAPPKTMKCPSDWAVKLSNDWEMHGESLSDIAKMVHSIQVDALSSVCAPSDGLRVAAIGLLKELDFSGGRPSMIAQDRLRKALSQQPVLPAGDDLIDELNRLCEKHGCLAGENRMEWLDQKLFQPLRQTPDLEKIANEARSRVLDWFDLTNCDIPMVGHHVKTIILQALKQAAGVSHE